MGKALGGLSLLVGSMLACTAGLLELFHAKEYAQAHKGSKGATVYQFATTHTDTLVGLGVVLVLGGILMLASGSSQSRTKS